MNRLEFPVEYSFDRETHSLIATVLDLNHISSIDQDFTEVVEEVRMFFA
jgi:hypothetical protein